MFARRAATQLRSSVPRQLGRRQLSTESGLQGAADNAFNRERAAVKAHAAATSDTWRKLSIYVVIPCVAIASVNAYSLWTEHWEHKSHEPPKEEQPEYPYQNIRTKNFFFGDGDKTLFWNDNVNYHKKSEE
ncbi:cytochrome c oxidase polypeptide VIa [Delphinella strobiligena]|nr:cytochrome c oxidase polypeptide VIa [Delphinella strobiligena]